MENFKTALKVCYIVALCLLLIAGRLRLVGITFYVSFQYSRPQRTILYIMTQQI